MNEINWRNKVDEKYLYTKNDKYKNTPIKDIPDKELLIKLDGIMDVARQRGFDRVTYDIRNLDRDYVIAICRIEWSKNTIKDIDSGIFFELPAFTFESTASAQEAEVGAFMSKYLECCAENRAFVRCVKRSLGINILTDEEVNKPDGSFTPRVVKGGPVGANASLEKICADNDIDIDQLKAWVIKLDKENKAKPDIAAKSALWESFSSIDGGDARFLVGVIQTEYVKQ